MAARFGLPPGVDDRTAFITHVFVVPHPGFGVDRLAHASQQAQAGKIVISGVHFRIAVGCLDEGADGGGCRVENGDLMVLDHFPEAACIRVGWHTFKHDLCSAGNQRAVGNVGVSGDPADVGRAPEDVFWTDVEGPLHGGVGPGDVTAGAVLNALGFAGGARRIQNEQRVLGVDRHGITGGGLTGKRLCEGLVPAGHHVARAGCAFIHQHALDVFAAAQRERFIHNCLERQLTSAPHLEVGGDHAYGAHVNDAVLQGPGGKPAKYHAVGDAQTGAGLHGNNAFNAHGHVDDDAITFLNAFGLERIGKLTNACQQFLVGDVGDLAIV